MSTTVKNTGPAGIVSLLLGGRYRIVRDEVATLSEAELNHPSIQSAIRQGDLTVVDNVFEGEAAEVKAAEPAKPAPKAKAAKVEAPAAAAEESEKA